MKRYLSFLLLFVGLVTACKKKDNEISPGAAPLAIQDTTATDTIVVKYTKLIFSIKTFNSSNGNLLAALFNSPANYTNSVRFKSYTSSLFADSLVVRFDSVPSGTYCMSCFHDANSNNVLDKNFFGAPTEGYGFSNNPGITFGAPSFNQLKFTVDSLDSMKFNVSLIYL